MTNSLLHIALVEPEIPQNAGNIGRTCVGLNAVLHFIGKLGFSMENKDIKRAGLDYWEHLNYKCHPTWDEFTEKMPIKTDWSFFSAKASKSIWSKKFTDPVCLVFGSESRGFPPSFYDRYKEKLLQIPMTGPIRSLNLATAVGIAAFEVVRQFND